MNTSDVMPDAIGCASTNEVEAAPIPSLTLRAFLEEAGRALRQTLPPEAWVEAVILKARQTRHGLSLELVEADVENTGSSALLRAFVGNAAISNIQDDVGLTLDGDLLTGVHARLRIMPKFDVHYHLQGHVIGIDPALADSLIAKRVAAIRQQLTVEGVLNAQKAFGPPDEITRVAVVHPDQSASWSDLKSELSRMENLGLIEVYSIPATFEGPRAPVSLVEALTKARLLVEQDDVDLVLLVRGGGASAGLGALVHVSVARAICKMPVPVITGLGHASDHSILDEVAWRSTDTPSKALHLIKALLRRRAQQAIASHETILADLDRLLEQIVSPQLSAKTTELTHRFKIALADRRDGLREAWFDVKSHLLKFHADLDHITLGLEGEAQTLLIRAAGLPKIVGRRAETLHGAVVHGMESRRHILAARVPALGASADLAEHFIVRQAQELERLLRLIEIAARRRLSNEIDRLAQISRAVDALGIDSTLARGFALPLDENRRIVRGAIAAGSASSFELVFRDGSVACRAVNLPGHIIKESKRNA